MATGSSIAVAGDLNGAVGVVSVGTAPLILNGINRTQQLTSGGQVFGNVTLTTTGGTLTVNAVDTFTASGTLTVQGFAHSMTGTTFSLGGFAVDPSAVINISAASLLLQGDFTAQATH